MIRSRTRPCDEAGAGRRPAGADRLHRHGPGEFGPGQAPPDEFQVVRRAPLILPPDYSLRPPEPGAPGAGGPGYVASQAARDPDRPAARRRSTRQQSPGELTLLGAEPTVAGRRPASAQILVAGGCASCVNLDDSRFLFILNFQRRAMTPERTGDRPGGRDAAAAAGGRRHRQRDHPAHRQRAAGRRDRAEGSPMQPACPPVTDAALGLESPAGRRGRRACSIPRPSCSTTACRWW